MNNLLHSSLQERKILLRTDTPLYLMNQAFPDGVPVKPYLLSLDGQEFYEFCPSKIPSERALIDLAHCLTQCPESVHYAFARHHVIAIPCEWAIEFRGEVAA